MSGLVTSHPVPDAHIVIRPATVDDVPEITALLNHYAEQGLVLPRTETDVRDSLDEFCVCLLDGLVAGCGALHVYSAYLAEVRSLAVREACQRHGIGARLVQWSIERAQEREIDRIFTLTYRARFFERLGFSVVERTSLPHKIWADCSKCPKAQYCDEVALVLDLEGASSGPFDA